MLKVILSGRLTRDPEARMMTNQMEVSKLSVACDYGYNKEGKLTEFVNCVAFGKTAETINRYCKKGTLIVGQGRIKNNSYEAQDGTKRYSTDVVIESFEFGGSAQEKTGQAKVEEKPKAEPAQDPYSEFGNEIALDESQLPF